MEIRQIGEVIVDAVSRELIEDAHRLARQVNEFRPLSRELLQKIRREILGERVFNSNAIEGNTLSLRETLSILDTGQIVDVGRRREGQEVLNLGRAIEKLGELVSEPLAVANQETFLSMHATLLHDINNDAAGRFRHEQVMIRGAKHQPPDGDHVPELMAQFFSLAREVADTEPIVAAAWVHWVIASVHPFLDGNGRMARLWQDLVLFSGRLTAGVIREIERKVYYAALEQADDGDLNPLIQLVARSVSATLQIYVNAQQELDEIGKWAAAIVSESVARVDDQRTLEYARWAHRMEHIRDAFERCAAQLNKLSQGRVIIDVYTYPMIEQATWETLRAGTGAKKTWFFRIFCRRDAATARYILFFGHHFWSPLDDELGQIAPCVCLLLSEQLGQADFVRLNDEFDSPVSLRELLVVNDQVIRKRRIAAEQRLAYDVQVDPVEVAQSFFEEVLLHRLS